MCVCVCVFQMAADAHLEANYMIDFVEKYLTSLAFSFTFEAICGMMCCGNQVMPFIYTSHDMLRIDYSEVRKLIAIFLLRTITWYMKL